MVGVFVRVGDTLRVCDGVLEFDVVSRLDAVFDRVLVPDGVCVRVGERVDVPDGVRVRVALGVLERETMAGTTGERRLGGDQGGTESVAAHALTAAELGPKQTSVPLKSTAQKRPAPSPTINEACPDGAGAGGAAPQHAMVQSVRSPHAEALPSVAMRRSGSAMSEQAEPKHVDVPAASSAHVAFGPP